MLAVLLFGSWTIRGNRREDKGRTVGQRIGGRVEGSRMEGTKWRGENGGIIVQKCRVEGSRMESRRVEGSRVSWSASNLVSLS